MKILVVFTGGTIGSCYNDGVISPDSSTRYKLIEMYKQNGGYAEFDTISPYTVLSENLNGEYFNLLYNSVKENINNYAIHLCYAFIYVWLVRYSYCACISKLSA